MLEVMSVLRSDGRQMPFVPLPLFLFFFSVLEHCIKMPRQRLMNRGGCGIYFKQGYRCGACEEFARGYIQNWLGEASIPEKSAQKIFATAAAILKAGTGEAARGNAESLRADA
jgi:hypothetical protein